MTVLGRTRKCSCCNSKFIERPRESHLQWSKRLFCSRLCANRDSRKVVDIFTRLARYQIKKSGCWGWSGTKDGAGYGRIGNRNKCKGPPERAHRVSFEKEFGPFDGTLDVLHKCDNPECTRPGHLFTGTHQDNMKDMVSKNRQQHVSRYGADNNAALFSESKVDEIRCMYATGEYTYHYLSVKFGSCPDTIRKIVANETYTNKKYIYSGIGKKKKRSKRLKLNTNVILNMVSQGFSSRAIAKKLNCSKTTILQRILDNV